MKTKTIKKTIRFSICELKFLKEKIINEHRKKYSNPENYKLQSFSDYCRAILLQDMHLKKLKNKLRTQALKEIELLLKTALDDFKRDNRKYKNLYAKSIRYSNTIKNIAFNIVFWLKQKKCLFNDNEFEEITTKYFKKIYNTKIETEQFFKWIAYLANEKIK
ncbi:MAG: hypothetical protein JXB50_14335 [Spirochaetes bacterium]|nr:hypothetical protein [Spirochaetota bacterium]